MKWQDKGIVLGSRPLGEKSFVVQVFTKQYGVWGGVVSPKQKETIVQPGTFVSAAWNARLEDHLGRFQLEAEFSTSSFIMRDFTRLTALSSICAILEQSLPARAEYPELYCLLQYFFEKMPTNKFFEQDYILFELCLLKLLGFGLTLTHCAVTHVKEDLTHISPKSGHAVCRHIAQPYLDKLLAFPSILKTPGANYSYDDVLEGLRVTRYFMQRHLFPDKPIPLARQRLEDLFFKKTQSA